MIKKLYDRLRSHTLGFRVGLLIFSILFVLSMFVLLNNMYAISIVRENAFDATAEMMSMYMNRVDDAFKKIELYWAGIQYSGDLTTLLTAKTQADYYAAWARLKMAMENVGPTYSYIDDLFIYHSTAGDYLDAGYMLDEKERVRIKGMIKGYIDALLTDQGRIEGKWQHLQSDDGYYLVRFFRTSDIYMGSCVKISRLISQMQSDGFRKADFLTVYENSGLELGQYLPPVSEPLPISENPMRMTKSMGGRKYLVISQPSASGDFSMVAMLRDTSIVARLADLQKVVLILCLFLLIFLCLFTIGCRKWILGPVKKHVYEEKLQRQKAELRYQKAELQYMKLQVNPHFYINCLNIIHNLSLMNKNGLVREMTTYLGNHLRYTLEGNTVDSLSKEIAYVKNYLHIQEIRFVDSLQAFMEVDPEVENVKVPPLIIQTFVENTVKYQVVIGAKTEIYILVTWCEAREDHRIRIQIWDNGEGFPENVLTALKAGEKIIDDRGEHFGIRNVIQRLWLIYQGREHIEFSNHEETGGAYIVIELPDDGGNA